MIENFNDIISFIIILALPLSMIFTLLLKSDLYKGRKSNLNKNYYDKEFDSISDEIDY